MYINSGYLNNSHLDFKDRTRPLIVGSCGTYRLSSHPKMPTYRPKGRKDFQIIYIACLICGNLQHYLLYAGKYCDCLSHLWGFYFFQFRVYVSGSLYL